MKPRTEDTLGLDRALHEAVKSGQYQTANTLIKAGASPNGYVGAHGWTDLHYAVHYLDSDMVSLLLDAGAHIVGKATCKDNHHHTPLSLAVYKNSYDSWNIVKQIASARNDDQSDYAGHRKALANAIHLNHFRTFEILLNAGTRVNFLMKQSHISDYPTWTPLHMAVKDNNPGMVEQLLKYSADPSIKDKNGKTPMQLAAELGRWDCVKTIADFNPEFTGKAIYEKLISNTSMTRKEFEKYVPYKEAVFAYILQVQNDNERVSVLEGAKNKLGKVGQFFWWQRGWWAPSLGSGMLKKVCEQLRVEKIKLNDISETSTAKVMEVMASAPPVEVPHRYYPDLSPVYVPLNAEAGSLQGYSFTNQMNSLPRVSELPRLPVVSTEELRIAALS